MWTFLSQTLVIVAWYEVFGNWEDISPDTWFTSQPLTVWFNQRLCFSPTFLPPQIINRRRVASRPLGVTCASGLLFHRHGIDKKWVYSHKIIISELKATQILPPSSVHMQKYAEGAFKLTTANGYDTILSKPVFTFYTTSHDDKTSILHNIPKI